MPNEPPMPALAQDPDAQRPLNEGFTEGGDFTLRSNDAVNFSVHSLFLSVASPVLAGMITVNGTRQNLVVFPEPARLVALMLKFIYPLPPPTILTFRQLDDAFDVARKYQLHAMKIRLQTQLRTSSGPLSISADPLRAWAVAARHGLPEETDIAMSLAAKRYDFPQASILHLARNMPAYMPFMKLAVVPLAKLHILADVLFSFHKEPMQLNSGNCGWNLCEFCAGMYYNSNRRSAPEWQARWADAVFTQLKTLPVHNWGPVFKIEFFNAALRRGGEVPIRFPGSHGTCTCPDSINRSSYAFERWTASVHEYLEERVVPVLLRKLEGGWNCLEYEPFISLADSLGESTRSNHDDSEFYCPNCS